jgi:DnaK suppressor protein
MSLGAKKLNAGKLTTSAKGVISKAVLAKSDPKLAAKSNVAKQGSAQKLAVPSRAALLNPNPPAKFSGPAKTANPGNRTMNTAPVIRPPKPEPTPIDPRLEPFRDLLEAKRAELRASLGDTRFGAQGQNGRVAEEDQAAVSHEEFISSKRNSMEFRMLRLVNAALDRITRGEYGICHACAEDISEKRLKAIPWAEFCVQCQDSHGSVDNDNTEPAAPGAVPALQVWNW